MIGDTPYDVEAARRAGVASIGLRCGGHWSNADLRGAIAIFDDPAALLAALIAAHGGACKRDTPAPLIEELQPGAIGAIVA